MQAINSLTSLPTRTNPDVYAQQYANQNGITLDEAKNQLRAKYGDPKAQEASIFSSIGTSSQEVSSFDFDSLDSIEQFQNSGNNGNIASILQSLLNMFENGNQGPKQEGDYNPTNETIGSNPFQSTSSSDPDAEAQEYADEHGITLDEAKEILKELYGEPEQR